MFNNARMSESGFIDLLGKLIFIICITVKCFFLDTPVIINAGSGDQSGDDEDL
jgi:hypothetical protein